MANKQIKFTYKELALIHWIMYSVVCTVPPEVLKELKMSEEEGPALLNDALEKIEELKNRITPPHNIPLK